jgi:hypothetical protein
MIDFPQFLQYLATAVSVGATLAVLAAVTRERG